MEFKEALKSHIWDAIQLPAEQLEEVAKFLIEDQGVECFKDAEFLTDEDLKPLLKTVQRRKLLLSLKSQGTTSATYEASEISFGDIDSPVSSFHSSDASFHIQPSHPITSSPTSTNWLNEFEIPWSKMPLELIKSLNMNQLPPNYARLRRELIRVLADAIRVHTPLPGTKAINIITQQVVDKYPLLKDNVCGEVILNGNCYLTKQLRNRLENLNRGSKDASSLKRKADCPVTPSKKKLSERYGCNQWEPKMTDIEEESQERMRGELFIHSLKGPVGENDEFVNNSIIRTFPLQRQEINKETFAIDIFKSRWPCFFSKNGLLSHFQELVGINLEERLKEELGKKASKIINYLKTIPPRSQKSELQAAIRRVEAETDHSLGVLVYLLVGYFGEDPEAMFKICEVTTDQVSMPKLSNTPCVVVCGSSIFSATNFFVLIDGIIINEDATNYFDAFLMLIASYFIFNIRYPETVALTLEFLQRFLLKLNPTRGTKQKKNLKDGIMPRVLSLINSMMDYEWQQ